VHATPRGVFGRGPAIIVVSGTGRRFGKPAAASSLKRLLHPEQFESGVEHPGTHVDVLAFRALCFPQRLWYL